MIELITPQWPVPAGVRALSTTRSVGIDIDAQLPAAPRWLQQVHGVTVVDLDRCATPVPADAAITRSVNTVCAIQTADCLPVLFAARDGSCVAAAHAGWRGLAAGVLENTVAALPVAAHELLAWLGPAIGAASFEVGEEVRAQFLAHDARAAIAFERNARERWLCDLFALARQRLLAAGVTQIHGGGVCTYSDPQRFFSYRRDGHTGRMASLIWMTRPAC